MPSEIKISKELSVFDALVEGGFQGLTITELAEKTGLSYAKVRRSLLTLEYQEWVVPGEQSSTKEKRWVPSSRLLAASFAFKKHCLQKRHGVEKQYLDISGEVLK